MNVDASKIEENLRKLKHRDPALFKAVQKKINQIAEMELKDIAHFKNLRHDLSDFRRVQIGSFVLIFKLRGELIILEDFDHHDRIYKKAH